MRGTAARATGPGGRVGAPRRLLFVGLGSIGQRHLRNCRDLLGPRLAVSAVRSRGSDAVLDGRGGVAAPSGLRAAYDIEVHRDLAAALATGPDLVLVCTPSSQHLAVAAEAAAAGCAMFVEKPLAGSTAGVAALVERVEARGLQASVGAQLRFHPLLRRLKEVVEHALLGRLLVAQAVVGEHLGDFHPWEDYRDSYAARADLGGGVVRTQIHELDYLSWLFGVPHRVTAVGGHRSRLETDTEDVVALLLEHVVDGRPVAVLLQMDYLARPPCRRIRVQGDAGAVEVDLVASSLHRWDRTGALVESRALPGFERNTLFLHQMRQVLAGLDGDGPPAVPLREGYDVLRVAEAALASMHRGEPVRL